MTIKAKISLLSTLVFGLLLAGFAMIIYEAVSIEEISRLDNRLEVQAEKVQAEFEEEGGKDPARVMEIFLSEKPAGMERVRMQLFDNEEQVLLNDSLLSRSTSEPLKRALAGSLSKSSLELRDEKYRVLWIPISRDGRQLCALQLAAPMTQVDANLGSLRLLFFVTIPMALLITALSARFITRIAFRPMRNMVETSRRISARNLETRLELPSTHDEVRLLGETLNEMMERLDAAFKSQKKFIADASHEIRTPLTVISNELQFAEKRTDDPTILESIRASISEVNRLAAMAEKMLQLTRLESSQEAVHLQPTRLDELMVECVQRVRSLAARKNISIETTIEEPLETEADGENLKSAVTNLLDNAIKYSNPGGRVAVRLCSGKSPHENIRLIVEDHGCGIGPADLPNIFKRFYRAESARAEIPGSGLGLAIAERIVTLHGGTIHVKSELGRGSVFTIELPHN